MVNFAKVLIDARSYILTLEGLFGMSAYRFPLPWVGKSNETFSGYCYFLYILGGIRENWSERPNLISRQRIKIFYKLSANDTFSGLNFRDRMK